MDTSDAPVRAYIATMPGFVCPALSSRDDGSFTVKGVKRHEAAWLLVDGNRSPQTFPIRLSPVDTAVDTDLGEIVLDPDPIDTQIKLSITNYSIINPDAFLGSLGDGLSIVSADGSHRLYRYWAVRGPEEGVALLRGNYNINSIASGEYYIIPGLAMIEFETAILDAIESGVDLGNSGIPTVTAASGQLVEQTVDMRAAYDAIIETLDPYK